jgi:hypothetical protein
MEQPGQEVRVCKYVVITVLREDGFAFPKASMCV